MLGVALEFKNLPDTTTPLNSTNLNNMQKLLVDLIYPVGTYYETSEIDFDPNTAWSGTWELDQSGTVLVSKSSSNLSKFNGDIGTIVGEEEHTLTVDELAKHSHSITARTVLMPDGNNYGTYIADGTLNTSETGGNQAHNNVQPSKIVNRWHRTA